MAGELFCRARASNAWGPWLVGARETCFAAARRFVTATRMPPLTLILGGFQQCCEGLLRHSTSLERLELRFCAAWCNMGIAGLAAGVAGLG